MNEDFLQYLWKHKKFNFTNLFTTDKQEVIIKRIGTHNINNSGPDFFNAQLLLDNQFWAGTVEIHKKSSDWYAHHHEKDPAYDNVILHVVWEDDVAIFRKDNSKLPALELQKYIDKELIEKYDALFQNTRLNWIQCESQIREVPDFVFSSWRERLFFERLQEKSAGIQKLLDASHNDWEAVLFTLLCKNFGLKVNGEAFMSIANSIDFSIIRKSAKSPLQLEALFLGQAGLLDEHADHEYEKTLVKEYQYLKHKFELSNKGVLPVHFFRLRPANFPTIRLSQLSQLYASLPQLFQEVIRTQTLAGFYDLFSVATSSFWQNHYTFQKESIAKKKSLSKAFIHLLLINTILPIKFLYARSIGNEIEEDILNLISKVPAEKNSIIQEFEKLDIHSEQALHSQAMLQLKNHYCDHKACLQCGVGNYLLGSM